MDFAIEHLFPVMAISRAKKFHQWLVANLHELTLIVLRLLNFVEEFNAKIASPNNEATHRHVTGELAWILNSYNSK